MRHCWIGLMLGALVTLSGCGTLGAILCGPQCSSQKQSGASSNLVSFLYPKGTNRVPANSLPVLRLPLRVGLAFLPDRSGVPASGLEATHRAAILERIAAHFRERNFIDQIVVIPDTYLGDARGFTGLTSLQQVFHVDVMALVSWDQVTYSDENRLSLGYLTIVGAYVLKGTRGEATTLMDMAVVDPASASILLRAGGQDTRARTSTLVQAAQEQRSNAAASFDAAGDQLIANFDVALSQLQDDIRAGKSQIRVAQRQGSGSSGGSGALDGSLLCLLALAAAMAARTRARRQNIR